MDVILQNIQNVIKEVPGVNYVDEDWGQLDYYSTQFPVQFPCVLVDVTNAQYSDIGMDKTATPIQRQIANATLSLTVANVKLTNSSGDAPQMQKNNAFSIQTLIDDIHKVVQGFNPDVNAGKLIRRTRTRVRRDDGVQEYTITYSFKIDNV